MAPTSPNPVPSGSASLNLGLLGPTPPFSSAAWAINDSGAIVGEADMSATGPRKAALWLPPDYRLTILPDLGPHTTSLAVAIGDDGTIGGHVCDSDTVDAPCRPAYWRNGVLHVLDGIGQVDDVCPCDGHTLVGRLVENDHARGTIWVDDLAIDAGLPNDDHANAELTAIANGFIIGRAFNGTVASPGHGQGYRWAPSTGWVAFGEDEVANDVNSHGTAVGGRGVLWPDGSMTPSPMNGEGFPSRINDSGVVAGGCVSIPGTPQPVLSPCEWTRTMGWFAIGSEPDASIHGINNSNMAVGEEFLDGHHYAVLWRP